MRPPYKFLLLQKPLRIRRQVQEIPINTEKNYSKVSSFFKSTFKWKSPHNAASKVPATWSLFWPLPPQWECLPPGSPPSLCLVFSELKDNALTFNRYFRRHRPCACTLPGAGCYRNQEHTRSLTPDRPFTSLPSFAHVTVSPFKHR